MEKILIHKDKQIENLAHEIAMIYVKEDFKRSYRADMIKSCYETGCMLNAYYQAKIRAFRDLTHDFKIVEVDCDNLWEYIR